MLALVEGFAGYSLPDDLLSGTGLRAAEGFMRSIPVIGSYVSFFVFDGPFPGEAIIPRLYPSTSCCCPRSWSACSPRTSGWCSCTSTPSSPGRAAPTTTSSATR